MRKLLFILTFLLFVSAVAAEFDVNTFKFNLDDFNSLEDNDKLSVLNKDVPEDSEFGFKELDWEYAEISDDGKTITNNQANPPVTIDVSLAKNSSIKQTAEGWEIDGVEYKGFKEFKKTDNGFIPTPPLNKDFYIGEEKFQISGGELLVSGNGLYSFSSGYVTSAKIITPHGTLESAWDGINPVIFKSTDDSLEFSGTGVTYTNGDTTIVGTNDWTHIKFDQNDKISKVTLPVNADLTVKIGNNKHEFIPQRNALDVLYDSYSTNNVISINSEGWTFADDNKNSYVKYIAPDNRELFMGYKKDTKRPILVKPSYFGRGKIISPDTLTGKKFSEFKIVFNKNVITYQPNVKSFTDNVVQLYNVVKDVNDAKNKGGVLNYIINKNKGVVDQMKKNKR